MGWEQEFIWERLVVNKFCKQECWTRVVHKSCVQKLWAKIVKKCCKQKSSTKVVNKSCENELSCEKKLWTRVELWIRVVNKSWEQMPSNFTSMSDDAPICLGKTFLVGWVRNTESKTQLRPTAAVALPELGNKHTDRSSKRGDFAFTTKYNVYEGSIKKRWKGVLAHSSIFEHLHKKVEKTRQRQKGQKKNVWLEGRFLRSS